MGVLALDFDGVLCDSVRETAVTAWRAGAQLWPEWRELEPPATIVDQFVEVRPLLETGYQAILLMRVLADGASQAVIEREFPDLIAAAARAAGRDREELVTLFGQVRDNWIEEDSADWLRRHRFYPGVAAALNRALHRHSIFILTTKQSRFADALLTANGVSFPRERIFGLETGTSKAAQLQSLRARPEYACARFHFVEDRLATLERVAACRELDAVQLCLAAWGYVKGADLARAACDARLRVCQLADFLQLLA